jgi:hypothetical protein
MGDSLRETILRILASRTFLMLDKTGARGSG